MTTPNRITLLHLWSVTHPRDFVRRVEDLFNDLYERVEKLEAVNDSLAIARAKAALSAMTPGKARTKRKKR